MNEKFISNINSAYQFKGKSITLGSAMLDKQVQANAYAALPLSTVNRHGLIAGATGTGKTKSLQYLAEQFSLNGIGVLMMDIKGDVSGLAKPGVLNDRISDRYKQLGLTWSPQQLPVELMSISEERGIRMRATVSEFGPVLLSKIMELNDNQAGVISIVFKYCDDKNLPLLDIKDFRTVLQHITEAGKEEVKQYGNVSAQTVGVILRKLLELESQGADHFFGEVSFEVEDLIRKNSAGYGYINVLRLCDIQSRPKLFSTFMLCLLAEIYEKFPEEGDKGTPKLAIFIDEAHLIFKEASKALLDQIETIIKLIRSKGVGIYFCTQSPDDIPEEVLSQLGLKIQHALRAFTAKDRKAINLAAQNYPMTDFYKVETLITELGIGEALVTALSENGTPTMLAHTMMCAPSTRMDILSAAEQEEVIAKSELNSKYNKAIDRESAYEMLTKKIQAAPAQATETTTQDEETPAPVKKEKASPSTLETVMKSSVTKTVVREVARGLLGILFGKSTTTRRRR